MLEGRHLIEPDDLSVEEIDEICSLSEQMIVDPAAFQDVCRGKILAALFFEPSTRTRLSFEAAMLRLGGAVEGFSDAQSSSSVKGESLSDTIRVVSSYVDVIAMRSPKEGAALLASRFSSCPIINAGDGGHFHPTQTLTDLVTIRELRGGFENLTVGFCGDLKFGRTVHSLVQAMCRYKNNKFVFISPSELAIPEYMRESVLDASGAEYESVRRLEDVIDTIDILYMTRVQKERFSDLMEYERVKDVYILKNDMLANVKDNMRILHPLPRVNEIAYDVDDNPHAYYIQQAQNGLYARQALFCDVLGITLEEVRNDKTIIK